MTQISGGLALITGGAQGIGFAIAEELLSRGASVVITDIDHKALSTAEQALRSRTIRSNQSVSARVLDVSDSRAFDECTEYIEHTLGPISILCNNAGIGVHVGATATRHSTWRQVLSVNLGGVINGINAVLARMLERGTEAHIVNVASGAGLIANDNISYVTSKYAVVGLTESLRVQRDVIGSELNVTVVCPGAVKTAVAQNSAQAATGHDPTESDEFLQRFGLDPATVAVQVVDAVEANRFYVITDRWFESLLNDRHEELIASLPKETQRDRDMLPLLQERTAYRSDEAPRADLPANYRESCGQ